jgi:hypothetical protein
LANPKSATFDTRRSAQQVRRLDVAVDDALLPHRVESLADVARDRAQRLRGEAARLLQLLRERMRHELHGRPRHAVIFAGAIQQHHIRVLQARDHPHLAQEAFARMRERVLAQDLQRHRPPKLFIRGAVDHAAGAGGNRPFNDVARDSWPRCGRWAQARGVRVLGFRIGLGSHRNLAECMSTPDGRRSLFRPISR